MEQLPVTRTWKLAEKHPHNKKAILRQVGEEEKWFCKKVHARAEIYSWDGSLNTELQSEGFVSNIPNP